MTSLLSVSKYHLNVDGLNNKVREFFIFFDRFFVIKLKLSLIGCSDICKFLDVWFILDVAASKRITLNPASLFLFTVMRSFPMTSSYFFRRSAKEGNVIHYKRTLGNGHGRHLAIFGQRRGKRENTNSPFLSFTLWHNGEATKAHRVYSN